LHAQPVPRGIYQILARNLTDVGLRPTPLELSTADFEPRRAARKVGPVFLTWTAVAGLPPALMLDAHPDLRATGKTTGFVDATYQSQVKALIDSADEKTTASRLREVSETLLDAAFFQPYMIVPTTTVRADTAHDIMVGRYGRSMRAAFLAG
jgi:peptide/nickel transport system substrate-binding protein